MLAKDQEIAFLLSYQLEHVGGLLISQSDNLHSKMFYQCCVLDHLTKLVSRLRSLDMNLSSPSDADMTNVRELNSSTILAWNQCQSQTRCYLHATNK